MQSDSRRKQILQNVVETIQGIQGPPYTLRIPEEQVKRRAGFMEETGMYPSVYITPGSESDSGGPIGMVTLTMRVKIRIIVEGDMETIADAVEDGLADVRHIMMVDTSRGSKALDTVYKGCGEPVLNPGDNLKSQLDIDFDVLYRTDFADPTQP